MSHCSRGCVCFSSTYWSTKFLFLFLFWLQTFFSLFDFSKLRIVLPIQWDSSIIRSPNHHHRISSFEAYAYSHYVLIFQRFHRHLSLGGYYSHVRWWWDTHACAGAHQNWMRLWWWAPCARTYTANGIRNKTDSITNKCIREMKVQQRQRKTEKRERGRGMEMAR